LETSVASKEIVCCAKEIVDTNAKSKR